MGMLPFVKFLGLFFLPFAYLTWIGTCLLVLSPVWLILTLVRRGLYRYVEEGIPLVARIQAMAMRPAVILQGFPVTYEFGASIEYHFFETGEMKVSETKSSPFLALFKDGYSTSYRVGDYVTAIYLSSNPARTLRLYGFLDLKPGLGLVERDAKDKSSFLKVLRFYLFLFSILVIASWHFYALETYQPLEMTFEQFLVTSLIGAVLLGGGGALVLFLIADAHRWKKLSQQKQFALATGKVLEPEPTSKHGILVKVGLLSGALFLGWGIFLIWAFSANALLDRSQPQYRQVTITRMVSETHKFLFRTYFIEYRLPDSGRTHRLLSTPDHMSQFENNQGIAEIHEGWLGWPWVATIRPVKLPQQQP